MMDPKHTGAGCTISSSIAPKNLEQHHTEHGFSGIPEEILKKLCAEWDVRMPSVPKNVSELNALQAALVVHHEPGTSAEEVVASLRKLGSS